MQEILLLFLASPHPQVGWDSIYFPWNYVYGLTDRLPVRWKDQGLIRWVVYLLSTFITPLVTWRNI